ncbi:MAG: DUF805 domain-containing protein [Dinoroseobacter sp.]|nr:DUF805 domain-containing protein [Dinoroseobacter sp.]MDJ0995352.1 DUF805 domain-containing protein [Dinoroseobacter sp.]
MSFSQAIKTCFGKFATFSGRASRSEYWWFFLFLVLLSIVTGLIDGLFFTTVTEVVTETGTATVAVSNQPVQSIAGAVVFLPHLAVAWRRMHDSGRSGLFALFPLLLLIGALAVLVFGIGIADLFASGGRMDILFTRLTLLLLVPTLLILIISPLLMLWWLTRPGDAVENAYGPVPGGSSS